MKTQTISVVLLVACFWLIPAFANAQADTPSPFDDSSLAPDEGMGEEDYGEEPAGYDEPADDGLSAAEAKEAGQERAPLPLKRKAKVVEKKLFPRKMKHELNVFFGLNPSDSYVFGIMEGARYNFHIHEMFAIQAVGAYCQNFNKDSTEKLTGDSELADDDFIQNAKLQWFANLDFVFYPIYGKFALLSSVIAHYDVGIQIGGGVMGLDNGDIIGAPDIGIVSNFYILEWLSLRADFMYYMGIATDKTEEPTPGDANFGREEPDGNVRGGTLLRHNYFVTLGLSFHLPVD